MLPLIGRIFRLRQVCSSLLNRDFREEQRCKWNIVANYSIYDDLRRLEILLKYLSSIECRLTLQSNAQPCCWRAHTSPKRWSHKWKSLQRNLFFFLYPNIDHIGEDKSCFTWTVYGKELPGIGWVEGRFAAQVLICSRTGWLRSLGMGLDGK